MAPRFIGAFFCSDAKSLSGNSNCRIGEIAVVLGLVDDSCVAKLAGFLFNKLNFVLISRSILWKNSFFTRK